MSSLVVMERLKVWEFRPGLMKRVILMIFCEIRLNRKNLVQGFEGLGYKCACCDKHKTSFCLHRFLVVSGSGPLSILLCIVINESIVKICLPTKWTSVRICFESGGFCTKRTHEVTGTLCGGHKLLLEEIGAGIRVGGCLFVSDRR